MYKNTNINLEITITTNKEFKEKYYIPLFNVKDDNSINLELFMRSLKLISVIEKY